MQVESESVLDEAHRIIHGDRRTDYGGAYDSFRRIATMWSVTLNADVTPQHVALCLVQLKVARAVSNLAAHGMVQRDSIVDIAGYAGCLEMIQDEMEELLKRTDEEFAEYAEANTPDPNQCFLCGHIHNDD